MAELPMVTRSKKVYLPLDGSCATWHLTDGFGNYII